LEVNNQVLQRDDLPVLRRDDDDSDLVRELLRPQFVILSLQLDERADLLAVLDELLSVQDNGSEPAKRC